jgi:hypothetical protein
MPVDRNFWKHYYFVKGKDGVPPYQCPICSRGVLKLEGNMLEKESGRSIRHQRDEDWEPDHYIGAFCCLLKCSNDHCEEIVAVSGASDVGEMGEYGDMVTVFSPQMFTPPLHILPIPKECPHDVFLELREAFKLYWSDRAGGLNHIRKAVELIMDHLKIRTKKKTKTGKFHYFDLHGRIEEFRKKDPVLADRLMAIKWLGNVGSHSSEVSKDAFFDACDLLEDFIHSHFEKRGSKIIALTKKVIKRKGRD